MRNFIIALCFIVSLPSMVQSQYINPTNRQVVLQGFWWDYENRNYINRWADYLTRLAPRLKEVGIDAIWIPPVIKNPGIWVGYSPFDHYDLGDKYQKGVVGTRFGDKDQLLRMIAVMKANGIDVIVDIGLNHVDGAGSASGAGGQDPAALDDGTTDKFKNFRYVSYKTPALNTTAANYLARSGRFPKNWQNFYPSPVASCCNNDQNSVFWGPDVAYEAGSIGESSNAIYNPQQDSNYMRTQSREWMIWLKKQTGVDGFRLDAVKHFPAYAMEDFLWNLQWNAGFASGGEDMWAVGEYVDGGPALDNWTYDVQDRAGTFDFKLRFALSSMVNSLGGYDLGSIVNEQQTNRYRTSPFVNNHDTYRPILSATGNYNGWDTSKELSPHIEPMDPRSSVCHAITMAMDGSPLVFFEDLFLIGYNNNRFYHNPRNTTELPFNEDVLNLIWCHQNLHFKDGAYKVRWQAPDALVIERSTKALIAANDSWDQWQNLTGVQTDWPDGTQLIDYSGANGTAVRTVYGGGKVDIDIPPCNGTALEGRRGYSVWAPQGIVENYENPAMSITQEWELADDLGDSHSNSLLQGGALPNNSTECRKAGTIFPAEGTELNVEVFAEDSLVPITLLVRDNQCNTIDSISGLTPLNLTVNIGATDWYNLMVRNAEMTNPGQKVWVKANYQAPADASVGGTKTNCSCIGDTIPVTDTTSTSVPTREEFNLIVFPNPNEDQLHVMSEKTISHFEVINIQGQQMAQVMMNQTQKIWHHDLPLGVYFIRFYQADGATRMERLVVE